MTTYEDSLLAARFAALAPEPLPGDWAGVLSAAGADERNSGRRRKWALAVVAPVAAVVAVALFWPAGREGDGIIDRARAAVAGGPVVHIVLRAAPLQVYDLERDEYRDLPAEREQWYDPARGLHEVETIGSTLARDEMFSHEYLEEKPQFASIVAAYRRALAGDEASLGPSETVQGQRVHWIGFSVEYPYGTTEEHEVAVDAETFKPRFLRIDAGPIATVLSFETLASGEGDFTPERPESAASALWLGPARIGPRTAAEARDALRGALWLGDRFQGIALTSIREIGWEKPEWVIPVGERTVRALELCYGTGETCAVSLTQATRPRPLAPPNQVWPAEPPPGTLAFADEPGVGFVIRDGVYVTLEARSREELIAAAKALTPIP